MAGTVEERLTAVEAEVARLKARLLQEAEQPVPWWEEISGVFKDDPLFEEAVRYGREWREAQRMQDDEETDVSPCNHPHAQPLRLS
jgi:hypothetical protein